MKIKFLTTFSWKLFFLVLLAIVPASLIILNSGIQHKKDLMANSYQRVMQQANSYGDEIENITDITKQILITLSYVPDVKALNPASSALLAKLRSQNPIYANIIAVKANGDLFASAIPTVPNLNYKDRKYFIDSLKNKDFAPGEYAISRSTNLPVFAFAYPIFNNNKEPIGAVIAALDLSQFSAHFSKDNLVAKSIFGILDHRGFVILYHTVGNTNHHVEEKIDDFHWQIIKDSHNQIFQATCPADKTTRIHAYRSLRLTANSPPYMYVFVGYPTEDIIASAYKIFWQNLSFFSLICLMVLYATFLVWKTWRQQEQTETIKKQLFHSEKLASIGTLASGIAHEINNPLAIISGSLDVLKTLMRSKGILDEYEPFLERQKKAIDRIANIINGLRTFARKPENNIEHVDVHKVIRETVFLIEEIYKKLHIELNLQLADNSLNALANESKLQHILMNLLSNAKDATEESTLRKITIRTEQNESFVYIHIIDNGSGISDEALPHIFDPFFTTKPIGKGTGLGLSISHSLIESMSGQISVTSKLHHGSNFTIQLPRG